MKGGDNMGEMLEGDGVAGTQASDKDPNPRAHVRREMHRWTTNQG